MSVRLEVDPDSLGVEMPDFHAEMLNQDDELRTVFDGFTAGKKRGLIHFVMRRKDIDDRIELALAALRDASLFGPPGRRMC